MDGFTRVQCYPWATEGQIEAMEGSVFGHSFLVLNRIPGSSTPDPIKPLQWNPSWCQECGIHSMLSAWNWELGMHIFSDRNYRCCSACWSVIKMQLWDHLEAKITGRAANTVWGFLIEPATRSKRHRKYCEWLFRLNWPEVFYLPLLPIPYSTEHSERDFWGWPF